MPHMKWHLELFLQPIYLKFVLKTSFPHSHGKSSDEFDSLLLGKVIEEEVVKESNGFCPLSPPVERPSLVLIYFPVTASLKAVSAAAKSVKKRFLWTVEQFLHG